VNSLYIAAVLFGLAWLLRRKPSEAVSSDWVKQQIAERGKRQQP
jgi:hypothetical protein